MKVGSAFFGWLTATGTAVLLTGVVAAAGTATGFGSNTDPNQAVTAGTLDLGTAGLLGAIVLLVVVFVSYFCGGYVAGRMARFSGLLQGLAVWLWALVIAIVAALVGLIWGANSNISENLNSFPRIPLTAGEFTLVSIVTALVVAAAGLAGALLGGAAGMRYHRRIDRAGLGD
ncbi:hypothetical protein [Cryobacterium sp. GrIS_2_6]|uniref:hypothetical protein n=1 Tax=Cryobacterium sp. GrIS_2_6 TaxID=3162785 RepID=UPI002E06C7FA|nr:heme/copper-type cytochrome/quinol oxidase subunit 2 [Cryobacterium psychrotolerans]